MTANKDDWFFYLLGAFLTLVLKYINYIRGAKAHGKTMKQASIEWFIEPSASNAFSWVTTIGIVWCIGALYIDRIMTISTISDIPVAKCFSFTLGSLMEIIAPNVVKWLVAKFPGGV
jgi:hypothetical protein